MNILMMNYEYPPLGGGGGVFNKQLAEELSTNNNVTVITSRFHEQKPYEIQNNVEIIRVPVLHRNDQSAASVLSMLSYFPSSLFEGYKVLKKRPFDLVHSIFAIPSAPSGLALARKFSIPHVLSILGGDIYDPSKNLSPHDTPLLRHTVKKMLHESDEVVSLSSDIKERACEHYEVSRNIHVIHLGIPKPSFSKKTKSSFHLKDDDVLLITIGRLVRRKALQDLIKVIHYLEKPNVKLIVVGDGPEKPKLETLTSSLNLTDRVLFFGYLTDEEKFQLLDISDIYVSSSLHEGFGIVFLEAMASGLPVVCYDNGGQTDFLIDEKTGFLVNLGNLELLTERIGELCTSAAYRKKMGSFNLQHVRQFYIDSCCEQYQTIYQTVLNKHSSRRNYYNNFTKHCSNSCEEE
jgi:glycosyltransferase involved in cell wall biosynthesis